MQDCILLVVTVAVKLDRLDDANKHFIKAIELDNKNVDYRSSSGKIMEELKNGND